MPSSMTKRFDMRDHSDGKQERQQEQKNSKSTLSGKKQGERYLAALQYAHEQKCASIFSPAEIAKAAQAGVDLSAFQIAQREISVYMYQEQASQTPITNLVNQRIMYWMQKGYNDINKVSNHIWENELDETQRQLYNQERLQQHQASTSQAELPFDPFSQEPVYPPSHSLGNPSEASQAPTFQHPDQLLLSELPSNTSSLSFGPSVVNDFSLSADASYWLGSTRDISQANPPPTQYNDQSLLFQPDTQDRGWVTDLSSSHFQEPSSSRLNPGIMTSSDISRYRSQDNRPYSDSGGASLETNTQTDATHLTTTPTGIESNDPPSTIRSGDKSLYTSNYPSSSQGWESHPFPEQPDQCNTPHHTLKNTASVYNQELLPRYPVISLDSNKQPLIVDYPVAEGDPTLPFAFIDRHASRCVLYFTNNRTDSRYNDPDRYYFLSRTEGEIQLCNIDYARIRNSQQRPDLPETVPLTSQGRGRGIPDHAIHQSILHDKQQEAWQATQPFSQETHHPPSVVPSDSNSADPSQFQGSYDNNSSTRSYRDQHSLNSDLQYQFETRLSFDQQLAKLNEEYQSLQSQLKELKSKPTNEFSTEDYRHLHATLHLIEKKAQSIILYYQRELVRIEEEDLKPISREIEKTHDAISVSQHTIERLTNNQSSALYGAINQKASDKKTQLVQLRQQLQEQSDALSQKREQLSPIIEKHKAARAKVESERQEASAILQSIDNPTFQHLQTYDWEPDPPKSIGNQPLDNTIPSNGMNCLIHSILRADGQHDTSLLRDMSQDIRDYLIRNNLAQENELLNQTQGLQIMNLLREQGFTNRQAVRVYQFTNLRSNSIVDPYITDYEFVPAEPGYKQLPPIRIFFNNLNQHFSAILPQEHTPSEATQLSIGSTQKSKRAPSKKHAKRSEALEKARRIEDRKKRKAAGDTIESEEEELNTDEEHRVKVARKSNINKRTRFSK